MFPYSKISSSFLETRIVIKNPIPSSKPKFLIIVKAYYLIYLLFDLGNNKNPI